MPQLVVGVMHIKFEDQGWSEKWYFDAGVSDPLTAVPLMKQIVFGRSAFFGLGVSCTYARCSKIGPAPDKETVPLPYPVGPHPTWNGGGGAGDVNGFPNEAQTCIQQVFQAIGAKWCNRYFRGIPDAWVSNKILQPGILPYLQPAADTGSDPNMSPGGGIGSHLGVCQAFWRYLIRRCVLTRKVTSVDYTPTLFRDIIYRQVTSKKTGRPFGVSRGRRPATLIT